MLLTNSRMAGLVLAGALLSAGSASFLAGCKPSAEKQAMLEQKLNQEVDDLFAKIQDLQSQGRLDEALELAESGLRNSKYEAHKPRFFSQKVELLLALDKDATAGDLVINTWQSEPQLARAVFGWVHNYYQQKNNQEAAQAWCKRLLALGTALPEELRHQVLNWLLNSAFARADLNAVKSCIDDIIRLTPPGVAVSLLQDTLSGQISAGQHALVTPLIAYLDQKTPGDPAYRQLTALLNMRIILATGNWPQYPRAFDTCVAQLSDAQLQPLTRQIYGTLQKADRRDLLEQSSKQIIFNATTKTNSVNLAARVWVESGIAVDKKLFPERLSALLDAHISPVQVGALFDRHFYDMVNDLSIIRSLCTLGERILAASNDENTVNNLKVKILDGAFIVDNFDLAVQMLEQGIPGKDKLWHDMSLPKVKAHRALAQKKPREAVAFFREFMNAWLSSKQEEEYDPTSGIAYSREWILGRNANRIANILESIPDQAEAAKAREEAKAYFRIAVKKAAADPEAAKLIKEETKNMAL